jgi:putative ABC transport system permease protein
MWPGEEPLGKRVNCCEEDTPGDPRLKTVVGVAEDVRTAGPSIAVDLEFYLPIEQVPPEAWEWIQRGMTIVVRGPADPHSLAGAVRSAVAGVDPTEALAAG